MLQHLHFARPRYFRLLLAASLALNALALALPLMTMQIYDRVLSNRAEDTLLVLSVGVIIAAVIEFILRICRSIVVSLNGAQFEHLAATTVLKRLLETEPRAHAQSSAAVLAQDIGSAARLKDYYGGQMMVTLLVDMPFILVFLSLEFWLAGWLAIVPMIVLCIFCAAAWSEGKKLRQLSQRRELQDNVRYRFITQSLQVIHTIKSLCLEASMARRFEEVQRESGQTNYDLACKHGKAGSLSYGFSQLMTIAVVSVGAPMAIYHHLTVGTLIACVLLSGQIMQPLQRGLALWIRFQDIALAKERLGTLLALPVRAFLQPSSLTPNHGALALEQVRFSYPESATLLSGLNLNVAPGDAVAITGISGSGKTSLLELIGGVYAPDVGSIKLSGMDTAAIPVSERSRYLAYLPMSGMILRGSIMDNLTGFNPALRAQARTVADQLGIEESVSLLPSGYDTQLEGNATDVVPPGLKQRISIARALLHKPRLILYDNADHGMDPESYTTIFKLLARLKGKATIVMISEDRNILSLADSIYELRHGQLIQTMAPSALVAERRYSQREAV